MIKFPEKLNTNHQIENSLELIDTMENQLSQTFYCRRYMSMLPYTVIKYLDND